MLFSPSFGEYRSGKYSRAWHRIPALRAEKSSHLFLPCVLLLPMLHASECMQTTALHIDPVMQRNHMRHGNVAPYLPNRIFVLIDNFRGAIALERR
ncbi:hypothetical protein P152DRAFT_242992 [Eremomyces bilateralis CBS 781.70]|uniref:Uncharacterized protein n=1 Tax=Eremomyces bilateralis CBS 781.70 TaxID=1392243 RepID=A0A6G1GAR9_9PEZI|nr:uncharacterized protein P152DRAFT_242992 [Eremomyces bilateralis CBS 781.70]KAF1815036.1 hypothetical protein P152DRAFT_242992 [Eremomyces bilateralis CBS 781.70]